MGSNPITLLSHTETRSVSPDGGYDLRFLIPLTGYLIVLVVLVHAGYRYFDTTYGGENMAYFSILDRLFETLIHFPVAVFVFVSGFRFEYGLKRNHKYLDVNDHFLFTKFARKRFVRLYVPYIIWSAIYFLLITVISILWRQYINDSPPFSSIEGDIGLLGWINGLGNPSYQLWFLPMLLFVSIVAVFFRYVVRKPGALIAAVMMVNLVGWLFWGRQADDTNWLQWLLLIVVYEIGGFYGRRFSENGELPYQRLMVILGLFAIVARILNSSPLLHSPIEAAMTLAFPVASCVVFYRLTRNISDRNWLLRLGNYSGSIYILHEPFITTAVVLIFIKLGLYSLWSIGPIAAICLLLSILLYRLLRRTIPNIDRWLL